MKRREFLRQSAFAATALAFPLLVPRQVLGARHLVGPNDRIRVGFIGLGGRARWILKDEALPGAEVIAVADCFQTRCDEAAKQIVSRILDQFGWKTEDMGKAEAARAIEPLCMLWCIPGFLRNDWTHAFRVLR